MLDTDNLENTTYGLPIYITALESVGVENLTPEAKSRLVALGQSGFDKAKFIQSLYSTKLSDKDLFGRLTFFEMLYEIEKTKPEPKISIEELNEAVEAAFTRIEKNNEVNKSANSLKSLL